MTGGFFRDCDGLDAVQWFSIAGLAAALFWDALIAGGSGGGLFGCLWRWL